MSEARRRSRTSSYSQRTSKLNLLSGPQIGAALKVRRSKHGFAILLCFLMCSLTEPDCRKLFTKAAEIHGISFSSQMRSRFGRVILAMLIFSASFQFYRMRWLRCGLVLFGVFSVQLTKAGLYYFEICIEGGPPL